MSVADEIAKLVALHKEGVLTDAEFAEQKRVVLSGAPKASAAPSMAAPVHTAVTNTVTTQSTSKRYKAHQLIGAALLAYGLLAAFLGNGGGGAAWAISIGLIWYIAARFAAWWSNG